MAQHVNAPLVILGTYNVNNIATPISYGYTVSSTGYTDTYNNTIVQMGGIVGSLDSQIIGISSGTNSLGETIISVSGSGQVWCDSAVSCGQYLTTSINIIGVASGSISNMKSNYIFAKSLVIWDPNNIALYPNIQTKIINNTLCGLINCIINI